jgi:RNA polymerase sigma-70 factor, ECF subfamily
VRDAGRLDGPDLLQLDLGAPEVVEEASAAPEQHRNDVERSQQATLRSLGDARLRDIVQRYIDAWEKGDVDAIIALLAEDATIAMPPWATWCRGREVIAGFVRRDGGDEWRLVPTRASDQVAAAAYRWDAEKRSYVPDTLEVLALEGARVKHITAFAIPEIFHHFGLPDELASQAHPGRT